MIDVAQAVRSRMTRFQYLAILASLLIVITDGYDMFVMGFALPHIPLEFAESDQLRGYLLSAGLFGMAAGSILLAPLADRYGRRKTILVALAIDFFGLVASALAPTAEVLLIARAVTGLGVGAMAASLVVLVQEYSSDARRNLIMGFYSIGFPVGSLMGGWLGVQITSSTNSSWRTLFVFGAGIALFAALVCVFLLPESIDYLKTRRTAKATRQLERIAQRLGEDVIVDPQVDVVPDELSDPKHGVRGLLNQPFRSTTILSWVMYSCLVTGFYFISSWTPQLVGNAVDPLAGSQAGLLLSIGSFAGAITFGLLSLRINGQTLLWVSLGLSGIAILTFSQALGIGQGILITAGIVGVVTYVPLTAAAAVVPRLYPPMLRTTSMGWMQGLGRLFSTTAPIAAGYALAYVSSQSLYTMIALPLFAAAVCSYLIKKNSATLVSADVT